MFSGVDLVLGIYLQNMGILEYDTTIKKETYFAKISSRPRISTVLPIFKKGPTLTYNVKQTFNPQGLF